MSEKQNNNNQQQRAFLQGSVMNWRFLPEMPEEYKEVLVAFKFIDIPVQAYWNGKTWKGSIEVRDVMNDGYCVDSILSMQEDIYAWIALPIKPAYP
jgi:hypothetical protein